MAQTLPNLTLIYTEPLDYQILEHNPLLPNVNLIAVVLMEILIIVKRRVSLSAGSAIEHLCFS